jgi:aminoglycoside 3-N-acetyltransferase
MEKFDYSKNDIIQALLKVGVCKDDNIFVHSNLGFFRKLKDGISKEDYCTTFKEAILEVIGINGTLIVPTFSYSFCNNEIYDKNKTVGVRGMLSEFIREDPQSLRSDDANFSVAAIGKNAEYFTKDVPPHSFGENSFWERFLNCNGKICNFNFDSGSTFIHYVEKLFNVGYRFDKGFRGKSMINGREEDRMYYHFVYDLSKSTDVPDFTKFDKKAKELGLTKTANLGKGQIVCISARDTLELIQKEIVKNHSFLIKG